MKILDQVREGRFPAPRSDQGEYRVPATPAPQPQQMELKALVTEVIRQLRPDEVDALTLNEFWPRFIREHALANNQKPRGVDSKESHFEIHLKSRFGAKPMNRIEHEEIEQLKGDLIEAGRSPKTINNILSTLNKCLKLAVKWKKTTGLRRMPCDIEFLQNEEREVEFYDFEQYDRLVRASIALNDARLPVFILLGGDAGLRMGEMLALTWEDVIWKANKLRIWRSESRGHLTGTKNRKNRYVPLTDKLLSALNNLQLDKAREGKILLREDGQPCSEKSLYNFMFKIQGAAGLPQTGGKHILRHTFCSHLAMRGAHPATIKRLAGHSSLKITERYMHLAPSEESRAIELLDAARLRAPASASGASQPRETALWRRRESNPRPRATAEVPPTYEVIPGYGGADNTREAVSLRVKTRGQPPVSDQPADLWDAFLEREN